jgi:hypothetical protein
MTQDEYNGWTNYETWSVKLWIDDSHYYWQEIVQEYKDSDSGTKDVYGLAERIREEIEDNSPLNGASVYSQLLNGALCEVNWQEIAESLLEE